MRTIKNRVEAMERQTKPPLGKRVFVRYVNGDPDQGDGYWEGTTPRTLEEIEIAQLEGWECHRLTVEYTDDWKSMADGAYNPVDDFLIPDA